MWVTTIKEYIVHKASSLRQVSLNSIDYHWNARRVLKQSWPIDGSRALIGACAVPADACLARRSRRRSGRSGASTVNKAEGRRRLVDQPKQFVTAGSRMDAETQT